jgi:Ferric reductase NAD binding domain
MTTFCQLDLIAVDDVAGMFEVSMHVTNYDKEKEVLHGERLKQFGLREGQRGVLMHMGRPNIEEEVKAVAKHKGKALLFACGPSSLIQDCAVLSHKYGIDFRHETFEL